MSYVRKHLNKTLFILYLFLSFHRTTETSIKAEGTASLLVQVLMFKLRFLNFENVNSFFFFIAFRKFCFS